MLLWLVASSCDIYMSLRALLQQQLHRRGLLEEVVDGDGEGVEDILLDCL